MSKIDLNDPENPEWTEETFAKAKPMSEMPEHIQAAFKRGPGRPKVAAPKKVISIRLDPGVVDYFKSTGPGWQSRINDILSREAARSEG